MDAFHFGERHWDMLKSLSVQIDPEKVPGLDSIDTTLRTSFDTMIAQNPHGDLLSKNDFAILNTTDFKSNHLLFWVLMKDVLIQNMDVSFSEPYAPPISLIIDVENAHKKSKSGKNTLSAQDKLPVSFKALMGSTKKERESRVDSGIEAGENKGKTTEEVPSKKRPLQASMATPTDAQSDAVNSRNKGSSTKEVGRTGTRSGIANML